MRKRLLFLALVLVYSSLVSPLWVSAAGDSDENSPSGIVQPMADFFQRLDGRLSQIENRLDTIEKKLEEKGKEIQHKPSPPEKEEIRDFPITVSEKMKREPNAFVLMLQSRLPVMLKTEFYQKGHICHVSAVMCDYLVQNGYAKYIGNTPDVTVKILNVKNFYKTCSLREKGIRFSADDYTQVNWAKANKLIEQGDVELIMPRY